MDDLPLPVDTLDRIDILAGRKEHPLIGEHMDGAEIRTHGRSVLARALDPDVAHLVLGAYKAIGAVEVVHDPCEGLRTRHIKIQRSIFGGERVHEPRVVGKPYAQLRNASGHIAGPNQVNTRTIAVGEGCQLQREVGGHLQ